jgi:hyperosmotically inducible periplasmic protein
MKKNHIFTLLAAAVLATGCAGLNSQSADVKAPQKAASDATDDTAVTARTKSALQADPELNGFKIDVSTTQGVVRLKGEIKSLALRRKAEALVKSVSGVKSVDNQLIITG